MRAYFEEGERGVCVEKDEESMLLEGIVLKTYSAQASSDHVYSIL